jgi:predicted metal-dependent enzyme (double-stranded beta helix superfamily)
MRIPQRLAIFITDLSARLDGADVDFLPAVADDLTELVASDDWLPEAFAEPHPDRYTQYLLYRDPADRFSIVSFVWGPGQGTPIHDHTVWGAIGVLRGAERSQRFDVCNGPPCPVGHSALLIAGDVETFRPETGDIHQVANACEDRVSVSIHVYGADIGSVSRHAYSADGDVQAFVSAYMNTAESPAFTL